MVQTWAAAMQGREEDGALSGRMVTLALCAAGDESASVVALDSAGRPREQGGRATSNPLPSGAPALQGTSGYARERHFGSIFCSLHTRTFVKLGNAFVRNLS